MRTVRHVFALVLTIGVTASAAGQTPSQAPPQAAPAVSTKVAAQTQFPSATKVAFMNPERLFAGSAEGKRLAATIQSMRQAKLALLQDKSKQVEALRARRAQPGDAVTPEALERLDKDISRLTVEIDRATQDAEAEVKQAFALVETEFRRKLLPVIEKVVKERGIDALLTPGGSVSWVNPRIDLTGELIKGMDAAYPGVPKRP